MTRLPDPVEANIKQWTRTNSEHTNERAEARGAADDITWGIFGVIGEATGFPFGDVAGLDVVEFGCGTTYFSAWLVRCGTRPIGVDPTPVQLETARRMQTQTGLEFPLLTDAWRL